MCYKWDLQFCTFQLSSASEPNHDYCKNHVVASSFLIFRSQVKEFVFNDVSVDMFFCLKTCMDLNICKCVVLTGIHIHIYSCIVYTLSSVQNTFKILSNLMPIKPMLTLHNLTIHFLQIYLRMKFIKVTSESVFL